MMANTITRVVNGCLGFEILAEDRILEIAEDDVELVDDDSSD